LLNINKCPTCRKRVGKPNLYVKTRYDYVFGTNIFKIIKSNPKIIGSIKTICAGIVVLSLGIFFMIDKKYIGVENNYKANILFGILILIQLFSGIVLAMEDYFKKYWLYDEKKQVIESEQI
jgi:hypothetical protein